ncbi:MAG: hypothetical protein NC825_02715 [Candidatus Omnitrophica bacterium]|nr:hypothetical protein [Candidatus Omnitrophota bacterium]
MAKGDEGGFKIVSPFHKRRCKKDFYLYEKSTPALLWKRREIRRGMRGYSNSLMEK